MAAEKATREASDVCTAAASERLDDEKDRPESSLCKALAHRAIYGSNNSRRGRSRSIKNQVLKVLPSRLSKVSLSDETETQ